MHFHFSEIDTLDEIINNKKEWLYNWLGSGNRSLRCIGEFKKINLFVGSNNSGKSRFLRALAKSEWANLNMSKDKITFSAQFQQIKARYPDVHNQTNHSFRRDLTDIYNKIVESNNDVLHPTRNKTKANLDALNVLIEKYNNLLERNKNTQIKVLIDFFPLLKSYLINVKYVNGNIFKRKIYIPILRSIHENKYLISGNFKETIKINYGIEHNVFTGLELYGKVLDLKNSQGVNRKKIKQFEIFLSKHFFENKEVEITSNSKENELLFAIDDTEYPIYNLGDGIQSLIILLFPIFTAEKNDWFFIEEPETNLHPGLQRIFIQTLLQDKYLQEKNLKYFFTTHSNHFLDITLLNEEISIFQFQKNDKDGFSIKTDVKPSKDVLDVLGVNTSSVFLANTSIWVEGPTDRKYLSKLLNLYYGFKSHFLKEDIDYSFFQYGGNLIEHYLFDNDIDFDEEIVREKINSFALSNKIYLLADNDNADMRTAKGKRRKFLEENAQKNPNFLYQNTELKEIENLLPKVIIKDFLNSLVKDMEDNELINAIDFHKSDYDKIGLGEFYESLLIENGIAKKYHKSFRAESGTLKNDYKIKLADFAINSEYKYEDFIENNETLKRIIEKLYKFIKK
ncbi:AAA family ATPase [Winogradskyella forsetii]|uniref:AAA family ATPase n=1 Tax=Winogradskyella forsetii TaxID=2686077 RepID=UPI0015BF4C72|nr:ATP-binding protein [Winogradskyella forsetii]